jgi:hypothetical protein
MCLTLYKNSQIQKSDKSITVYKRLRHRGHEFVSPYYRASYKRGQLEAVRFFSGYSNINYQLLDFHSQLPEDVTRITKGIHAYTSLAAAKRSSNRHEIIVECRIPRRTPFIKGRGKEIASLALKTVKAVGNSQNDKEFNSTRKRLCFPF